MRKCPNDDHKSLSLSMVFVQPAVPLQWRLPCLSPSTVVRSSMIKNFPFFIFPKICTFLERDISQTMTINFYPSEVIKIRAINEYWRREPNVQTFPPAVTASLLFKKPTQEIKKMNGISEASCVKPFRFLQEGTATIEWKSQRTSILSLCSSWNCVTWHHNIMISISICSSLLLQYTIQTRSIRVI